MALVDMKRSKKESKESSPKIAQDPYGYGLNLELDHDHLQKLGIKQLPETGAVLHLRAHAHVRNTSEHNDESGTPRRSVSLQLRRMELKAEQKAAEDPSVQEGKLRGAKAAMDKALDAQEGKKGSAKGSAKPAQEDDEDE